jgi:predicted dienelactone hydrolase
MAAMSSPATTPMSLLQRLCALALVGCSAAAPAGAGVGLVLMPARAELGPVTVFYPSTSSEQRVERDAVFHLRAAVDGVPARGNGRLIVLSHGTGALPWVYGDLARALVEAGFVVALPQHRGDHADDTHLVGPPSWKLRPAEVSATIDSVLDDPRFAALVDGERVGVYGNSAGGHTALVMAGGRWSPAQLVRHCQAHLEEDFAACVGGVTTLDGGWLDTPKLAVARTVIRWKFAGDSAWYGHTDPRVRAVVASVPWAANFDLASLQAPRVPLGLVEAGQDRWLRTAFHVGSVRRACQPCETVASLPEAGHGAMLSPLPPDMPTTLQPLIADPPGFDRSVLPALNRRIADFFLRHLEVASPSPAGT